MWVLNKRQQAKKLLTMPMSEIMRSRPKEIASLLESLNLRECGRVLQRITDQKRFPMILGELIAKGHQGSNMALNLILGGYISQEKLIRTMPQIFPKNKKILLKRAENVNRGPDIKRLFLKEVFFTEDH